MISKNALGWSGLVAPHQHRRKVEAETVHVHIGHPVAQAVHDQGHGAGVKDVQAVARTGEVEVVAGIVGVSR